MNRSDRPRRVKGLGEVSIRVKDLDAMQSVTKKWLAWKCSGETRVLFSSKSPKAMAVIHGTWPSLARLTVPSSRQSLHN